MAGPMVRSSSKSQLLFVLRGRRLWAIGFPCRTMVALAVCCHRLIPSRSAYRLNSLLNTTAHLAGTCAARWDTLRDWSWRPCS